MGKLNFSLGACGVFLLLAIAAVVLPAQTLSILHSFDGTDGAQPYAPLVLASNGNLYGTTSIGGANNDGTVFEITTSGTLTTLHSFNQFLLGDGNTPFAGLLQASNGDLYGTTSHGGVGRVGSIFKVTPSGTVTTVASFEYEIDGANPYAGLMQASNGSFYGTAEAGGGAGTVYEVTPFGQLIRLYSFGQDGTSPLGGLVQAGNGNLYGTTDFGGRYDVGVLYEVTTSGTYTPLFSFGAANTGSFPYATMTLGSDGNLYGTTSSGGAPNGYNAGVVFKWTLSGTFTALHVFDKTDGSAPLGALVLASDGNFYGTTETGGANNEGTIFKITPSGTLTSLYSFCSLPGCSDGADPIAGLIQASNGTFYGTTYAGGSSNHGTVFSFTVN